MNDSEKLPTTTSKDHHDETRDRPSKEEELTSQTLRQSRDHTQSGDTDDDEDIPGSEDGAEEEDEPRDLETLSRVSSGSTL